MLVGTAGRAASLSLGPLPAGVFREVLVVVDTAARPVAASTGAASAFDRQVSTLLACGVAALAGLTEQQLVDLAEPLRAHVPPDGGGDLPFVLVVGRALVHPAELVPRLQLRGKEGFTSLDADDIASVVPRADVTVPDAPLWLLVDVDLGTATLDVPPAMALPRLTAAGRSPLTLEEGLAVVLQEPELLRTVGCFSVLGSRCGDRRVPALWVKRGGQPRLGWCWEGAPHTWLGSASCAARAA